MKNNKKVNMNENECALTKYDQVAIKKHNGNDIPINILNIP